MKNVYNRVTPLNQDGIMDDLSTALFGRLCAYVIVDYDTQEVSIKYVEVGVIHADENGISIDVDGHSAGLGMNHDRRSLEIDDDTVTFIERRYASSKIKRLVTYRPLPK